MNGASHSPDKKRVAKIDLWDPGQAGAREP
jgi:hypothetical protein